MATKAKPAARRSSPPVRQTLDGDQIFAINNGITAQSVLRATIHKALYKNTHNDNFILSSMPGLGKSFETQKAMKGMKNPPVVIDGNAGIFSLIVDIATAVYLAGGKHQVFVLDDCDTLYQPKNINLAKKMFDDTRKLVYGKAASNLKAFCTDLGWAAIEHWMNQNPTRLGFTVPLDNCTFLFLTNEHLPTANEVDVVSKTTGLKNQTLVDLHAIRRRVRYEEIQMPLSDLWGYVANVVINEKICEKFYPSIDASQKEQLLTWCHSHWANVTERNLSLIEKMVKDMLDYPTNYLDIWKKNYL